MFPLGFREDTLNPQFADADRRRRHSLLKLGLMACFAMLLIDSLQMNDVNTQGLRGVPAKKKDYESVSFNDSLYISSLMFGKNYSLNMKQHTNTALDKDPGSRDVNDISGVFRGEWTTQGPQLFTQSNNSIVTNSNNNVTSDRNSNDKGKLLIQLKSIVIKNLPSLRYVYGIMRVYAALPSIAGDMLIPVQGILEIESNAMTLLSTPQKTQFIAVSAGNARKNISDIDLLLGNHTALHDDIRRKYDQRMQALAASHVNNTKKESGIVNVHNNDSSSSSSRSAGVNSSSDFRRRLSSYSTGTKITNLHIANISYADMRSGIKGMHKANMSSPFNEKELGNLFNTRAGILKAKLQSRWTNRTASGPLQAHLGPVGQGLDLRRVELADVFSGRVSRAKGIPLGVEVLTDTYHNLQDQSFLFLRKNKFTECFTDSIMRLSIAPNEVTDSSLGSSPYRITNTAKLSGQVHSRDCPQSLNISASVMYIHFDELERKAEVYGSIATLISIFLIVLMVFQMKHSSAQSGFGKISYICICAQGILDAIVCIGHMLLCAAVPTVFFFHFIWVAILSLLLFSVFEMKTVINIFQARYSGDDFSMMRRRLTRLQTKFYCILLVAMGSVFLLQRWPVILVFLLYSVWVPQIIHSAKTGVRKPLLASYYIGTGIGRLYIPLYMLGCPDNIFARINDNFKVNTLAVVMLVFWTGTQLVMLFLQDKYGPRFFVPASWLPEHYDYCRIIPSDTAHTLDKECTICYTDVDISKREYMITPCDHLFHRQCLTQWVDIKLECPVCRASLPAVDFVWTDTTTASFGTSLNNANRIT